MIGMGIYLITNIVNKKIYVGSSSNLKLRKKGHLNKLKRNKHENSYLQNSYNKYGEDKFEWRVIEYVDNVSDLIVREKYWIDTLKCCTRNIGYNISSEPNSFMLGRKHSEETRKKLSDISKNRVFSEEHLANLKLSRNKREEGKTKKTYIKKGRQSLRGELSPNYGKKLSEETLVKISNALKGRKISEDTKNKISKANTGKKRTEEQREKMSLRMSGKESPMLGKNHSEDTKNKISKANTGKKRTEEQREKMSLTAKIYCKPPIITKKIINITTGKIFDSILEASLFYNIDASCISRVCSGERKTSGGFEWRYYVL